MSSEDPIEDRRSVAVLKRVVCIWSLAVVILYIAADDLDLLDLRPGGTLFATRIRWVFLGLFVVSVLVSRWSDLAAGVLAAFTTAGLIVMADNFLQTINFVLVAFGFLVPTAAWLAIGVLERQPDGDLGRRRVLMAPLALIAAVAGWRLAAYFRDLYFGPTHPESQVTSLPSGPTKWIWSGAVTTTSATVCAKLHDDPVEEVRLRYAPMSVGPASVALLGADSSTDAGRNVGNVLRFELDELEPARQYVCALEIDGELDVANTASFSTFPDRAASFTLAFGACARTGSNGAVFDAIRAVDPAVYCAIGDMNYGDVIDPDLEQRREVMELTLTRPAQAALHREAPIAYVWDDHDFGGNDAHRFAESRSASMSVYRQYVPHYPLGGVFSTVHQAFTIGRVRVLLTDCRSGRTPTPPDHAGIEQTMLGAEQLEWLLDELERSSQTHAAVVWVNPVPWIADENPSSDSWGGYPEERREIAEHIQAFGISNLIMVSGDAHMVAIDDGTNTNYSNRPGRGFALLHAAPLDRNGGIKGGPYTQGPIAEGGQFGAVDVIDSGGDEIMLRMRALDWRGTELLSHEVAFDTSALVFDS